WFSIGELSLARFDGGERFLILCSAGVNSRSRLRGLRFGFFEFDPILTLAHTRQHRSRDNCIAFLDVTQLAVDATHLLQSLNVAVHLESQFHLGARNNRR